MAPMLETLAIPIRLAAMLKSLEAFLWFIPFVDGMPSKTLRLFSRLLKLLGKTFG